MPATARKTTSRDVTSEIEFLTRALKAPTLREAVPRLAERARAESWTHEEYEPPEVLRRSYAGCGSRLRVA